jgi:Tol biopolymer transport system component
VTRKGEASPISSIRRPFSQPCLSPDGRRIAVIVESETYDVWILDVERDRLTRLSFGKDEGYPVWSPDGTRLVYQSSQNGPYNLYLRAADGAGSEERLTSDPDSTHATSWSPDGRLLALEKSQAGVPELWLYPFEKGSTPRPFLQTGFRIQWGRISPDGRWIAYGSNESGRSEVYVTTFPTPGGKWQISNEGGERPLWSPDGKEIFYRKDRKAMRVPVTASPEFSASKPEVLFEGLYGDDWDIARDGKRFVMIRDESAQSAPRYINVALDWFSELRARAPGSPR